MAKVHYTNIPCGAKPFGSEGGGLFVRDGNRWVDVGWHDNFGYPELPVSDDPTKVTCKWCQRILRKTGKLTS